MTAVLEPTVVRAAAPKRRRRSVDRPIILAIAAVYFLVPLAAAIWFTIEDKRNGGVTGEYYAAIPAADGFAAALRRSLSLAVLTVLGVLLVTVPAMLAVTLRLPRLRPVVEGLSLLPLVIPPIALVAGVRDMLALGPNELAGTPLGDFLVSSQDPELPYILIIVYIVLATPFAYRSLDAGIRSIDAKTLVDAARGLGASWPTVVWRVLLPNLRSAVLGAAFLTLGLVLGEYTIASILLFETLPTWLVKISGSSGQLSVAVSTASLLFTWILLLVVSLADRRKSSGGTA
ncbi:ABC transporter permease subunit [Dactylosporangium sp. AC04546]|uniref:ABC transporter permease n=1 Tax=Dactylosporangium sp. AC04546 TaxID=2862460 RepID=UPI001EDF2667|nr:ABC transporter permease subunit [Dactylosporangium sp. AC04546]WVK89346.1 ABC transporter permease subunit [Dactylosporangium sp. AC04546]